MVSGLSEPGMVRVVHDVPQPETMTGQTQAMPTGTVQPDRIAALNTARSEYEEGISRAAPATAVDAYMAHGLRRHRTFSCCGSVRLAHDYHHSGGGAPC